MKDNSLKEIFERHSKEDHDAFDRIDTTINKTNELIKIYGEHMSFVRKDLTELKTILEKHINDVKPMLEEYQEEKAGNKRIVRYGKGIVFIGAVISAIVAIIASFKKLTL